MISKVAGNQFEHLFERSARRQGMGVLRIPDGCKRISGVRKLIPVKTPCDFIIANAGKSALIDTKTQGVGLTFPKSNINLAQVHSICSMNHHGITGGYITWFRAINKVIFYDCEILRVAEEGIHWGKGIYLGPIENINLKLVFDCDNSPGGQACYSSDNKRDPKAL